MERRKFIKGILALPFGAFLAKRFESELHERPKDIVTDSDPLNQYTTRLNHTPLSSFSGTYPFGGSDYEIRRAGIEMARAAAENIDREILKALK